MVEAHDRLAEEPAGVALDQLAPPERFEPGVELHAVSPEQCRNRAPRKVPSDHRRTLQHRALLGPEALDARREQRVDGGRHLERGEPGADDPTVTVLGECPLLHQHAHQLPDEERIALAGGEHLRRDRGGQVGGADHVGREPHGRAGVETAERDHVGNDRARRHERRAQIAELGPRAHQHEERHAGAPLHQVLDEIEKQRLGPVQVVDHEHDRPRRGQTGEKPAHDEERLLGRRDGVAEHTGDPGRDAGALALVGGGKGRRDRGPHGVGARTVVEAEEPAEDLRERRERGAPGGVAMRGEDRRIVRVPAPELVDQAGLPEPRRPE